MTPDPDRNLAAKAAEQDGYFTIADARAVGMTEPRIRHRAQHVWNRVYDGVYRMRGVPITWKGRLRAACWAGGCDAFVSHRRPARRWRRARRPDPRSGSSVSLSAAP